ncbi:AAA family ATPase [Patulibacter brassicae]|uniref:AAA family ATPase n=1 Tax=Patulibacter brassicae TaxID=1705717 RepID=A0ABU4VIF3_9ACTN|nr:AAA family ATPase [Patulibacter brassicae]MDX8151553.1 AAA family ATPase [Patulibacter brassicae]
MEDRSTRAPLVGRAAELEQAVAAIAAVRDGAGRVLVVSGDPGIGKTALLDAIADEARAAGLAVLAGRATEHETDVPLGLAIDALDGELDRLDDAPRAALAADLGDVLPSLAPPGARTGGGRPGPAPAAAARRFHVHRALRDVLEQLAGRHGTVVVLDDLHWADEGSLQWVTHLLRRPPRTPALLVLALRPAPRPLARLLDALRNGVPGAHLELRPLPDEDAAALLRDVDVDAGDRPAIVREAGGNPLFLQELARVGAADDRLPPTILAAVELEVSALDPAARALLEGAAVAGDPFDVELAAATAGLGVGAADDALDAIAAADLVRPEPQRPTLLRFRHPLVRRAVYDAMAPGARRTAHGRAVTALTARGVGAAGLAHHVERVARVGDADAAATLVAAARASAGRAPATSARHLGSALALLPGAPPQERADLLAEQASALSATGRHGEARAALLEALELLPPALVERRVRITAALCSVDHVRARHEDALTRLRSELAALPEDVPEELRALGRFALATSCVYLPDEEGLEAWAGRAAPALREVDPATALCDDALVLIARRWRGRTDGLETLRAAVLERLAALDPAIRRSRSDVLVYLGQAEALAERNVEALRLVDEGLATLAAGGDDAALVPLSQLRVQALLALGDARRGREAVALAEDAARLQEADYGIAYALAARAELCRLDGDREDVERAAAEWPALAGRIGDIGLARTAQVTFALVQTVDDPERRAERLAAIAGARFERLEPEFATTRVLPFHVRALLASGRRPAAEAAAALLAERAAALALPGGRAAAALVRAEIALDGSAPDASAALRLAEEAAAGAAERGFGELRFHADLVAARALALAGERDAAVGRLRAAADRATAVAAWALRDAAASELRRLGARLPAALRVAGERGELTEREEQVAELVAAGRSNKEVAKLLFLSPKTVEHTLSRVYAKLGVRSRTELAATRPALARSAAGVRG